MKKKILLLFIAQIITNYAFTQNYENFEPDKIKIDNEESIVYQQFKNKYDLTISKHNLSRNDKNDTFQVLTFKENLIEKFIIKQNKKTNLISIRKLRVSKKSNDNFQKFIDNLIENNFFDLKNENINCWVENNDKSISIAPFDNNLYYFEIINKDKYKLIYSDCIESHPNFIKKPDEKERLKYWDCLNLFKDYWD
ncbi:hypothetical protein [Lutibacter sp.]|uniref:hypothetical protein n=1 Tax=Lutibacter sp. TaxID=1925666 RepID=UPI00356A8F67